MNELMVEWKAPERIDDLIVIVVEVLIILDISAKLLEPGLLIIYW